MLLANAISFARNPQVADRILRGEGLESGSGLVIAITPLLPEHCLSRLAPMSHALIDFELLPYANADEPGFLLPLSRALRGTAIIETEKEGVVEEFLKAQSVSAPETLVVYGTGFNPMILPVGMPTINLLVVERDTFADKPSTHLQELWRRTTLMVPRDQLDPFAKCMAASRL